MPVGFLFFQLFEKAFHNVDIYLRLFGELGLDQSVLIYDICTTAATKRNGLCGR